MELPLWILAISQLLVDILIIVLIFVLIAAAVALVHAIKSVSGKANIILDDVKEASDYVKDSKIGSFFKIIFSPSVSKKLFKKTRKLKKKKKRLDDESFSW